MTAKIISGREVAENILQDLKKRVDTLKKKNITPKLVVVLVGDMKASASYVAQKEKFAVKAGIDSEVLRFNSEISESEILNQIDEINKDDEIHGVIVQLPLPDHISVTKVLNRIDPKKDVDGHLRLFLDQFYFCLLYTSPSPRDKRQSRMPSSA